MFGIDDAILGSVGGSIISGLFGRSSAQSSMDFQAQQTGTSYQRAVKDMQAAGLNPMLAYNQGGAGSGAGAVAPGIQMGDMGVSSAQDNKLKAQQLDLVRAQIEKVDSETRGQDIKNNLDYMFGTEIRRAEMQNVLGAGDLQSAQIGKAKAETSVSAATLDEIAQRVKTGQASAAQLNALANNLKLDSVEKEQFAKLMKDLGESGAAGKFALPFLQLLMRGIK